MKTFILLLSACACAFAQSDIAVLSVTNTFPESGVTITMEFFTRNGQTNLIRRIRTGPEGVLRVHRFYHAGQVVANLVSFPQESEFNTEATPYCVTLKYGPSGNILLARIGNKDGILLDEFTYTNGIFSPVEGPLHINGLMKPKFDTP